MTKWVSMAFALVLLMPLSAAAAVHCAHGQGQNIAHGAAVARHAAHAESVESVPAAGAVESCPDHPGQPHNTHTAHCKIKEGCCIKADGPLSTGLSDRLPTNDDTALSIATDWPTADVRRANAPPYQLFLPQDRTEPDPRPPSA